MNQWRPFSFNLPRRSKMTVRKNVSRGKENDERNAIKQENCRTTLEVGKQPGRELTSKRRENKTMALDGGGGTFRIHTAELGSCPGTEGSGSERGGLAVENMLSSQMLTRATATSQFSSQAVVCAMVGLIGLWAWGYEVSQEVKMGTRLLGRASLMVTSYTTSSHLALQALEVASVPGWRSGEAHKSM